MTDDTVEHVLPDVMQPGLRLVFCGTAAGTRSARERAYYAHPGNMFWRTVYDVGLTPRLLRPEEFPLLPTFGIGLTDLAKHHYGNDDELPRDAFDAASLRLKIERFAPRVLAFTSKNAARGFYRRDVEFGEQASPLGTTRVFVLPSPSGQARASWRIETWADMAAAARLP